MSEIIVSGKRKTAIAKATLTEGSGRVTINKKPYQNLHMLDRLRIEEPLRIAQNILTNLNFNVEITVRGGGGKGQLEAARVALTRAIDKFAKSKPLTEAFLAYDRNLLVADVRRKETRKPGDSKARAKRQSSKR